MLPLRFVADHLTGGIPNVVVDGSPNADTVLTLSHWPGMLTPSELRDDLSAQIAFRALAEPHRFDDVDAVTNNHFDQDGLAGIFTLVDPDVAMAHRDLLIDVARAGDFGTFHSRDAARIAMAIAALDDDHRSPLPTQTLAAPYPQRCADLYEWALPRLGAVLDDPNSWRELWQDEDAHLDESLDAIRSGQVTIAERPELDLAIVNVPTSWSRRNTHRFTESWHEAVHPMAVNSSTERLRIVLVQGNRYRLELRYESWVMFMSRPVLPRPDLRVLATELSALEITGAQWRADPPGSLTPKLELVDDVDSGLAPDVFAATVERFLAEAPAAWDPFAPS
ncbi:MAG: hypothetical protein JWN99_330 [Ilumatobacteraceae bacterium]|nr:hypothetical protein [Ilumatobacteraceae bacterium]